MIGKQELFDGKNMGCLDINGNLIGYLAHQRHFLLLTIRIDSEKQLVIIPSRGDTPISLSCAVEEGILVDNHIQNMLDLIINQNTFFDSTGQRYGSITPGRDDDQLLLTVDANGQQKEVALVSELTNQVAINIQTTHVFAIEQFLLAYHPLHIVLYATNPDPDGGSDDGR